MRLSSFIQKSKVEHTDVKDDAIISGEDVKLYARNTFDMKTELKKERDLDEM